VNNKQRHTILNVSTERCRDDRKRTHAVTYLDDLAFKHMSLVR